MHRKLVIETNEAKLETTHFKRIYRFTYYSSKEVLIFDRLSDTVKYKVGLESAMCWGKHSKKSKLEWNRMFAKKQDLVNRYYLYALKDKRFLLPNLVRYNSRYKNTFNYFATLVSYDILDNKHIFLRLMYSKVFNHNWKYFVENYDNLEQYLRDNLSARQMLISFVSKFAKINKLWKDKKFKWIIQATPKFYLKILKVVRYLNRDQYFKLRKKDNITTTSILNNFCKHVSTNLQYGTIAEFNSFEENERDNYFTKPCPFNKKNVSQCMNFDCPKRRKISVVIIIGNGMLNSTMNIVNLFNNKPSKIFIANSRTQNIPYSVLNLLISLIGNSQVKFISTNPSSISFDPDNIIIPNMKYIASMVRHFIRLVEDTNMPICAIDRYIKRILDNLNKVESKRTQKFIKTKLENFYLQYKLTQ